MIPLFVAHVGRPGRHGTPYLRASAPVLDIQVFNLLEVAVAGYEDHTVTFRGGGDPDVVLRNRAPLLP